MKRLDGIYRNPNVKRIDDLTIGDLVLLIGLWIIDGDRQLIKHKSIDS